MTKRWHRAVSGGDVVIPGQRKHFLTDQDDTLESDDPRDPDAPDWQVAEDADVSRSSDVTWRQDSAGAKRDVAAALGARNATSRAAPELAAREPATRKSLQLGRRAFHMINGIIAATAYAVFFTHKQAVYFLGTTACLIYILDQIRIKYPELMLKAPWIERTLLRAEEQVKESAMIPYAIAILLTIITFPKEAAIIAIYTLGVADPLSAIVGIKYGRRHIVPDKTLEGSLAFFVATFAVATLVFVRSTVSPLGPIMAAATLIAVVSALVEMLPLRLDDNLTIPIFVGFTAWISATLFGLPVG